MTLVSISLCLPGLVQLCSVRRQLPDGPGHLRLFLPNERGVRLLKQLGSRQTRCPVSRVGLSPRCPALGVSARETSRKAGTSILRSWDYKEILIHFRVENIFPLKPLVGVQSIRILYLCFSQASSKLKQNS